MASNPFDGTNFITKRHGDIYDAINPVVANLSHENKAILITGAGRGIGRSIALRYAEANSSHLILASRTASQLDGVIDEITKSNTDIKILKLELDISDEGAVAAAVEAVKAFTGGKLDILINNAGAAEPFKPIGASEPKSWWKVWEISVFGTYLMTRAFLPLLLETAAGAGVPSTIVNTSSIGAHVIMPGMSAYQTSRLAMLRFGEFVSAEYGDKGINVHTIHPGGVRTELTKGVPDEMAKVWFPDGPNLAAGVLVWLTSENREWLNGRYVDARWDVDELLAKKEEIVEQDKLIERLRV